MVIENINKWDVDISRELFSSILLAGDTASMQISDEENRAAFGNVTAFQPDFVLFFDCPEQEM